MPAVTLTAEAVTKTLEFMSAAGEQESALRVGVRGGGCAGFQYLIALDTPTARDVTWEQDDITVICDRDALPLLEGSVLDYKQTLTDHGFQFDNPNARNACGCGSSFRVDDGAGCSEEVDPADIYGLDSESAL